MTGCLPNHQTAWSHDMHFWKLHRLPLKITLSLVMVMPSIHRGPHKGDQKNGYLIVISAGFLQSKWPTHADNQLGNWLILTKRRYQPWSTKPIKSSIVSVDPVEWACKCMMPESRLFSFGAVRCCCGGHHPSLLQQEAICVQGGLHPRCVNPPQRSTTRHVICLLVPFSS